MSDDDDSTHIMGIPNAIAFQNFIQEETIYMFLVDKTNREYKNIFEWLFKTHDNGTVNKIIETDRVEGLKTAIQNKIKVIPEQTTYKTQLQQLLDLLPPPAQLNIENNRQEAGGKRKRRSRKGKKSKSKQNIRRKSIRRRRR